MWASFLPNPRGETMAFDVTTKDCTQLSDAELAEMADLAPRPAIYEIGELSKQAEAWVLVTLVREGDPSAGSRSRRSSGSAARRRSSSAWRRCAATRSATQALKAVMGDNYRRALMAFPDEDVLVGTRMDGADGFEAFKVLADINPRPGHKASGEERAWGRRLAKRFGMEAGYDDQTFVVNGDGSLPAGVRPRVAEARDDRRRGRQALQARSRPSSGDCLVAFGWIMAEELLKYNG